MAKAKTVFTVVGVVNYECEDVLGIYTSKRAALKRAEGVAVRPLDYYAEYTNYDRVEVYAVPLNVATDRVRDLIWAEDGNRSIVRSKSP